MNDVEERLRRAAEADDRESVWAALDPLRGLLADDERVARMWAEALRAAPDRAGLVDEAREIVEAWSAHPGIVAAACDALLRRGSRRPFDEPPASDGPAQVAAEAAGRCYAKLDTDAKKNPEVGGRLLATRGNAQRLLGPRRLADAARSIEAALALEPRGEWLLDLAIIHKEARDMRAALETASRARAALGGTRAALFNLAIAATGAGEGEVAAAAWRDAGIDATCAPGSLPFVAGLPPAMVRLPTLGSGAADAYLPDEAAGFETVWVQPLSPCHGVVRSPTHREARADFGDVVLWDGAPAAVVEREGAPVPVFPLLAVLREGDERRFRFLAMQQQAGQIESLGSALPDDVILYLHGERVEVVCPRCAAGDTLVKHEHLPAEEHRVVFGKLVVPASRELADLSRSLDEARADHAGVLLSIPALYEALGDTAQAGKHHKRWSAIERVAGR